MDYEFVDHFLWQAARFSQRLLIPNPPRRLIVDHVIFPGPARTTAMTTADHDDCHAACTTAMRDCIMVHAAMHD